MYFNRVFVGGCMEKSVALLYRKPQKSTIFGAASQDGGGYRFAFYQKGEHIEGCAEQSAGFTGALLRTAV